jgi:hypothetical protein
MSDNSEIDAALLAVLWSIAEHLRKDRRSDPKHGIVGDDLADLIAALGRAMTKPELAEAKADLAEAKADLAEAREIVVLERRYHDEERR